MSSIAICYPSFLLRAFLNPFVIEHPVFVEDSIISRGMDNSGSTSIMTQVMIEELKQKTFNSLSWFENKMLCVYFSFSFLFLKFKI